MILKKIKILIITSIIFASQVFSQEEKPVIGVPFIVNFFENPTYRFEGAILDIDIDTNGYIYAASEAGILTYQGEKWEALVKGNFNALTYDKYKDRIWAGYSGGFGCVQYDSLTGKPYFKSISDTIDYTFKQVYYILPSNNGVYFFTNRKDLFFYDYKKITQIKTDSFVIKRGYIVNDTLYVVGDKGMGRIDKDKVYLVGNQKTQNILKQYDIRAIFSKGLSTLEMISKEGNIIDLDKKTGEITVKNKQSSDKLKESQIYRALELGPSAYLLATLTGGLIAIDDKGNILDILDDKFGLGSNAIYDFIRTPDGTLWLGSSMGPIKVYTNIPFRYSGNENGIKGVITDYTFFNKYLLITTQEGLFYTDLTKPPYEKNYFDKLSGQIITYKENNFATLGSGKDKLLLIASHRSILYLDTNLKITKLFDSPPSITVKSVANPNNVFYIISTDSLYKYQYVISKRKLKIKELEAYFVPKNFHKATIDNNDNLYMVNREESILYFFNNKEKKFYKIKAGDNRITNIKKFGDKIIIFTEGKTYYTPANFEYNGHPEIQELMPEVLGKYDSITDIAYDNRMWWMLKGKQLIVHDALNKKSSFISFCMSETSNSNKLKIDGDYVSFITKSCFINFSKKQMLKIIAKVKQQKAKITLKYIIINGKKIYAHPNKTLSGKNQIWTLNEEIPARHKIQIKISNNDPISFFGYEYKITNYESKWTPIYESNEITLMNLPAGKHQIKIRGTNKSGIKTNEIIINIKVAPPFYQSIYALTLYLVLILILIYLMSKRASKAEREKKKLEKIVVKRTKEIMEKNEKLEELSEELRQQKEELEAQNEKLKLTNLELRQLSLVAQKTDNSVLILDSNGNIEWWNEGFYRLFKYKFDKFKNTTLREKKIKLRPDLNDALLRIAKTKESITYTSHEILNENKEIWYQTNITPILDDEGEIFRYVVIDIDITDIKLAEKQIEKQKTRLEAQTEILKKGNKILQEQKKQLQQKTMEILSSLEYAKKIQKALFSEREIKQIFKEYFVLFRAKEIVSGDFFYVTRKENKIILAVADSTGHGVPGAFMSVLGSTLLKDTIEKISELKPNLILQRLRNTIIMALHQENKIGNIKDGMDIGLVILEPDKKQLMFSGANIPLFITRKKDDKYEIIEIKADRMPIGLHDLMNKPFTLNKFEIQEGDRLYMNTDGFTDQFGGPDNKRYKKRRFKKFLLSIQELSMFQQKQKLIDELDLWMGANEQIDDILIVGVALKEFFHK